MDLRDMMIANKTSEVSGNQTSLVRDGKSILSYLTVVNPGTNWQIELYDSDDVTDIGESNEIGTWITAAGGGTFEIMAVVTRGIVYAASGDTPGDAVVSYMPTT